MRVPWDEMREEAVRTAAREEASKIVAGALTGLHEKLSAMYQVEANGLRAGLLYGIMGAVQDTVREIKTLGYGAEPHKPVPGLGGEGECLVRRCQRGHDYQGRHTS